tara:strand:+ start:3781 stop:6858 length:3078 start_codon:yes stop_codon:yes gene_type:complete
MADWKKIIVSGSDAHLKNITGSGGLNFSNLPKTDNLFTPLVISSSGEVFTGSAYALASGGNTVGGSNLTKNIAIIGAGGSLIRTASSHTSGAVDFNNAQLSNISAITASGNLLFSGSGTQVYEIKTTNSTLHITASGINVGNVKTNKLNITSLSTPGNIPIVGAGGEIVDDADLSFSTATDTLTVEKIDNVHAVKHITSSNNVLAQAYFISESGTRLADVTSSVMRLGDSDLDLHISASSLNISTSGGVTMSVVPVADKPPFVLAQNTNNEIVKVPLASVQGSGGTSTNNIINNVIEGFTTCSDNTNIDLTVTNTTTAETETLIGEILINDIGGTDGNTTVANINLDAGDYLIGGTIDLSAKINQFMFKTSSGYTSGSLNAGDTVIIRNNAASVLAGQTNLEHTTTILGINPNAGSDFESVQHGFWDSDNDRIGTFPESYSTFHSMSLAQSLTSAHHYIEGATHDQGPSGFNQSWRSKLVYYLYKVTAQSSSNVQICLSDDLHVNSVTASGLLFSGSLGTTASIGYIDGINLDISASNAVFTGNVDASSYSVNAIQVIAHETLVLSGSTTFGSSSLSTHTFTGSLLISGSEINLVNGQFTGRGTGLTHVTASSLDLGALTGSGLFSSSAQVNGAAIGSNNTISGVTLGSNLYDLTVDNTTIELQGATTTYNGGAAKTIQAKTATVTDSGTALATGDQIYDHVTDRISGLTGNTGTVTSVATTGTVSGITLSGGTITTTGTITLGGSLSVDLANDVGSTILPIANGGTNANTAAGAATNLGLGTGDSPTFTGLTLSGNSLSIDGTSLTATVTELNLLNGVTATTTEINYLDGVTSAIQNQLDALANPANATTFSSNVTIDGALDVDGDTTLDNVTIDGNLTVNGTTTTLSSTELQIEDRFILIGSGSSTDNTANLGGNVDVGIIFETRQGVAGAKTPLGTALYHDASDDRLNVARGVPTNIGTNQIDTAGNGIQTGHVVTVRTTESLGTQLNTTTNKSAIDGAGDVIFGSGEMVIDDNKDIWIYTA